MLCAVDQGTDGPPALPCLFPGVFLTRSHEEREVSGFPRRATPHWQQMRAIVKSHVGAELDLPAAPYSGRATAGARPHWHKWSQSLKPVVILIGRSPCELTDGRGDGNRSFQIHVFHLPDGNLVLVVNYDMEQDRSKFILNP
jgi:hypothetical protein